MTVLSKAARLRSGGNVRELPGRVYEVEGDHGTYLVAVTDAAATSAPNITCSCPADGACSHAVAATALFLGDQANETKEPPQ